MTARAALLTVAALLLSSGARADGDAIQRPPLAEPIFTESVTDIDGYEPGEVEFDLNGSEAVARRNGARIYLTSIEAEWKVWKRLGVRLEPSFTSSRVDGLAAPDHRFGIRGAAGWNLLHDFQRDFHLQIEASGRFVDDAPAFDAQPGEAAMPFNADLKAAIRPWGWTVRASVGTEAGATAVHAPLRLQLAVLHPFASDIRFGFFGLEADSDFGRRNPLIVAPNIFADLTPVGIPARLGVALPVLIGAPDTFPAAGVYLRVLILTSREARFESQPKE